MATTEAVRLPAALPGVVKRNTALLAAANGAGWITTQTVATLAGIIADNMTGDKRWVGIPVTLSIIMSATAAPYAGRLMDRLGRRPVLIAGLAGLAAGGTLAAIAVLVGSFAGFLLGIAILGAGSGATALSRSAAADMYPAARRARGISWVIMGGAAGAILGPQILKLISDWSHGAGADPMGISWLLAPAAALPALVALIFLRPDPRDIGSNLAHYYPAEARAVAAEAGVEGSSAPARPLSAILKQYPVVAAIAATALVQAGMVMVMVTAALTLKEHNHGDDVYAVMTSHFLGMLGLSIFVGRIADRIGRRLVILAGTLTFIAGAVTVPIFENPLYNSASLFLVGLGWSLCYVAGNAVLSDVTRPLERGRVMGLNDLLTGMAGAVASLGGGLILGGAGFLTVGAVGLVLGLVPFALALRLREREPGEYVTGQA